MVAPRECGSSNPRARRAGSVSDRRNVARRVSVPHLDGLVRGRVRCLVAIPAAVDEHHRDENERAPEAATEAPGQHPQHEAEIAEVVAPDDCEQHVHVCLSCYTIPGRPAADPPAYRTGFPMLHAFLTAALAAPAQPPAEDWKAAESAHLRNIRQVTFDFARAGEGYFSPAGRRIIYQAEEKGTGNPFYQIFVQDLDTGKYRRISPGVGRTTCSFFRPDGKKVIFASSHEDPEVKKHQDAEIVQRAEDAKKGVRRRYQWDFDPHMKIYEANPDGTELKCLTPGAEVYTAEGSYSADGKRIVYSAGNAGDVQLYIMNADGTGARQLTHAPNCYNGGPVFGPAGTRVIFR